MQITIIIYTSLIKPMRRACKQDQKAKHRDQNEIKPMRTAAFELAQEDRNTWILAPGRPSDKDNGLHAPTQLRLARTHGTHGTHETKTKTQRSRSPGYGGTDKPN